MKELGLLIIFILTVAFTGCDNETRKEKTNHFVGLWSLYQMESYNPQTKEWREFTSIENGWPNGIKGHILYDDLNHMSVHIVPKNYENTSLKFKSSIDSMSYGAIKHLATSYTYFANYTIDEKNKTIEHKRISHSNPDMWNETVIRKFSFAGDTLILEPVEKTYTGTRLKWIKVSNINKD